MLAFSNMCYRLTILYYDFLHNVCKKQLWDTIKMSHLYGLEHKQTYDLPITNLEHEVFEHSS